METYVVSVFYDVTMIQYFQEEREKIWVSYNSPGSIFNSKWVIELNVHETKRMKLYIERGLFYPCFNAFYNLKRTL